MQLRRLVFVTSSLFSVGLAQAETIAPVVVTATRFTASIDTAPVNVTVISAEDIANSGANSVSDVLRHQPGVNVRSLFGAADASVDLGGFGENGGANTLVLLNGRRLNDLDLQGANLNAVPLDSIARIEIIRGSASVLYGDNAVGGVINIVTKNGFDGEHAGARMQIGSFQTQRVAADLRTSADDVALSLAFDSTKSDGYRDNNALENANFLGETSRNAGQWNYGVRVIANREKLGLPGALFEPQYKSDPTAASGQDQAKEMRNTLEGFIEGDKVAAELATRYKHQEYVSPGSFGLYEANADLRTLSFTPRVHEQFGMQTLIAGLDLYRSHLETASFFDGFDSGSRDITQNSYALYIADTLAFNERTALNVGARRQHVGVKVDQVSGSLNNRRADAISSWDITLSHKHLYGGKNYLRAARSFRSPVLDEMWSYYTGDFTPIKPQTGRHYEMGTEQTFVNHMKLSANLFRIDLQNEIFYDNATFSNINLDETRHQGFNVDLHLPVDAHLSLDAGVTRLKAFFRSGPNESNTIPLVPRNKLTLAGHYRINEQRQAGLAAVYTGGRYFGNDDANDGKQLPGYTRLDLNYRQQFTGWQANIKVQNLTNIDRADTGFYRPAQPNPYAYYPLPERAIYLEVATDL